MINLFLALSIALIASGQAWCLDQLQVVVNAPRSTPEDATLYLTGNTDQLCQWKPDCLALTKIGTGVYQTFVAVSAGENLLQFKVTRGSWLSEAVDKDAQTMPNFIINLSLQDSAALVSIVNWRDMPALGVTGHLDHLPAFFSPELNNSRDISVWLPADYGDDANRAYPVIYMHDGQNLFDPATSFLGIDWGIDETMTDLIAKKSIKSAIVVGINNTPDRDNEYDFSIRGKAYGDFIVQTLKPYIDSHYRTDPDRDHTFTMGSSMGALISLSLLWTHSDVFSGAAGLSLPAFENNNMIINMVKTVAAPKQPIRLYFDHGDQGQDASYEPSSGVLMTAILAAGIPPTSLGFAVYPYANHSELDWSRRLSVPLEFLLAP